jgi:uncharacterized OsmC-like protein
MSDIQFKVQGTSLSDTKLRTQARQFEIDVDEPQGLGGKDEAANPVEYILVGLAGCINVVAHTVAKEIDIKIDALKIDVSGGLNPNKFLGVSETERAGFKGIEVNLNFQSNANPTELKLWLAEINKRCPVKDNLFSTTPVNLSIKSNQTADVEFD